jgi:hypothetical protein
MFVESKGPSGFLALEKAWLMNQYLSYAIALEVKEGWGDTMAAAFSDTIVER